MTCMKYTILYADANGFVFLTKIAKFMFTQHAQIEETVCGFSFVTMKQSLHDIDINGKVKNLV